MAPDQKTQLESVVKGLLEGDVILSPEFKTPLVDTITKLEEFIVKVSSLEKDVLTEAEKDILYSEYKELMKTLHDSFKVAKYNFTLTKNEYKFLHKQICRKLKYNRQDNVIALRVKENFFNVADGKDVYQTTILETFQTSIDDLTLISHLNAKIELEGITEENNSFATITEKIGAISRVYEYIDMKGSDISETVINWLSGLEPEANAVAVSTTEDVIV